ncbi:MAG: hypothetical protein ACKOWC_04995 [Limnohabitans sp.]
MTEWGLLVNKKGTGEVLFDSRLARGGVLVDMIQRAPGGASTHAYPAFAGYTGVAMTLLGNVADGVATWDTALGYPRLNVGASTATVHLAVWMR